MLNVDFGKVWEDVVRGAPFPVPEGLGAALAVYHRELVVWNRKINLVRFSDARELAVRHFLDSLSCLRLFLRGVSVIDVGSGAGFPGLVIAIARPDIRVTLVEATMKKAHFLDHVCREARVQNVDVLCGRIEAIQPESFDVATGRAVAKPELFVGLCRRVVRETGMTLVWTRPAAAESLPRDVVSDAIRYRLPDEPEDRTVLVIRPG